MILQIQEWLSDSSAANNGTVQLIAAILYMYDGNVKEALKVVGTKASVEL